MLGACSEENRGCAETAVTTLHLFRPGARATQLEKGSRPRVVKIDRGPGMLDMQVAPRYEDILFVVAARSQRQDYLSAAFDGPLYGLFVVSRTIVYRSFGKINFQVAMLGGG